MSDTYEVRRIVRASPKRLFEAWLDSHEHSAMTGRAATAGGGAGDAFSALDGLIIGENLQVEPYQRFVQTWRATEPGVGAFESRVKVALATGPQAGGLGRPHDDGTTVTVRHSGLPLGQTQFSAEWWEDSYFKPMDAYFAQGNTRFTRPSP
jgi:activator of HSP90 ATPase